MDEPAKKEKKTEWVDSDLAYYCEFIVEGIPLAGGSPIRNPIVIAIARRFLELLPHAPKPRHRPPDLETGARVAQFVALGLSRDMATCEQRAKATVLREKLEEWTALPESERKLKRKPTKDAIRKAYDRWKKENMNDYVVLLYRAGTDPAEIAEMYKISVAQVMEIISTAHP